MNREIKFRAWDEQNKIMHNDFQFIKSGDTENDWVIFKSDKQECFNRWVNNPYFSHQMKIMQYTGLKDKNGKEIYDLDFFGDTLELYISWCDKCRGWQLFHDGDDCFSCSGDIHLKDCEEIELNVVGNILENPELIK